MGYDNENMPNDDNDIDYKNIVLEKINAVDRTVKNNKNDTDLISLLNVQWRVYESQESLMWVQMYKYFGAILIAVLCPHLLGIAAYKFDPQFLGVMIFSFIGATGFLIAILAFFPIGWSYAQRAKNALRDYESIITKIQEIGYPIAINDVKCPKKYFGSSSLSREILFIFMGWVLFLVYGFSFAEFFIEFIQRLASR